MVLVEHLSCGASSTLEILIVCLDERGLMVDCAMSKSWLWSNITLSKPYLLLHVEDESVRGWHTH